MIMFVVYIIGIFVMFFFAVVKAPTWLEVEELKAKDYAEIFLLASIMAMIWPVVAMMMAIRIADNFIDGLDR